MCPGPDQEHGLSPDWRVDVVDEQNWSFEEMEEIGLVFLITCESCRLDQLAF